MILPGSSLTPADLDALARCGISTELAQQALLRRVDSFSGAELVGRNGRGDYGGIIFPYIWPGEDDVREYRLRRDHPDLEQAEGGRFKEKNKYLWPPGRGNLLYLPPNIVPEWLTDLSLSVVFTEGEKKCLSLWELAWYGLGDSADRPRFLPIGLAGVWGWRGTIGKTEGPSGERQDVKGTISDFERIAWTRREGMILFDANVVTNDSVRNASEALAAMLQRRQVHVLFADIPADAGVNGIDDYIGAHGPESALRLIENAYDPKAKHGSRHTHRVVIDELPWPSEFTRRQIEFVVPDLIAAGAVTVLTSEPGAGKTTLATHFCDRVARDASAFGKLCSERCVLYLDRENDIAAKNELLNRLHIDKSANLKFWGGWNDEEPPSPASPLILEWVDNRHPKPLVVIDALRAFLSGDENDSRTVREFFDQLRILAHRGCAVLVFPQ